jgi:sugar/nucleoside kinase (ribokinase family)
MQTHNHRIWGFGSATLDFRIQTADYGDNYKEKLLAQQSTILGGGATANCLVQVARLGGQAFYIGKMGADWIAKQIMTQLQKERICCTYVLQDSQLLSPFNMAIYAGTNWHRRGGYLLPNSLSALTVQDIKFFVRDFQKDDWCLVEIGEIPLLMVHNFCQKAREKGVHLVLDVDLDPIRQCGGDVALVHEIFHAVEYIIPNVAAMRSLYPEQSEKDLAACLAQEFHSTAIVTAGKEGCYFTRPGEDVQHQPSLIQPEQIVDPVGAGDAFHGGVVFALAAKIGLPQSVRLGSNCAAMNCASFGAREGMPYAHDIDWELIGFK